MIRSVRVFFYMKRNDGRPNPVLSWWRRRASRCEWCGAELVWASITFNTHHAFVAMTLTPWKRCPAFCCVIEYAGPNIKQVYHRNGQPFRELRDATGTLKAPR